MTVLAWMSVVILVMSVVLLAFTVVSLVRTLRQNRTTQWAILRTQVYNKRALEAQREMEESAEALLRRLRELNEE
jgi:predicted Holliday junction resolvase-like endonuclease